MADQKISQLSFVTTLDGTEIIPLVQSSSNKKIALSTLSAFGGRVYNVEAYGAVHDGKKVYDGAMSSGSAVLTSASNQFSSTDVGKIIVVTGAGASSVALKTTILSYQSAGQVTLTAANASGGAVSSAHVMWGTDDTVAIQAAENARFTAGGGWVYFPNGIYIINGALQTSVDGQNPNCQIYIRSTAAVTAPYNLIQGGWIGESKHPEIAYADPGFTGVVLLSTLITSSGTRPAVVGTHGATGNYSSFNMDAFEMKNIGIYTHSNKGATRVLSSLNFEYMATFNIESCVFTIDSDALTSADPSAFEHFGAWLSNINNNGPNHLTSSTAAGYKYGFIVGEHTQLNNPYTFSNVNGYVFIASYQIKGYALAHQNTNHVLIPNASFGGYATGNCYLDISLDLEQTIGGKWYSNTTDIIDSGNFGRGSLRARNSRGTGFLAWLATGATNLQLISMGSILGRQTAQSGLGPTTTTGGGTGSEPQFELGNDIATSSDANFARLYLTARQSGTANLLGQMCGINSTLSTEKRVVVMNFMTAGATNTGRVAFTLMNAGSLTATPLDIYPTSVRTGVNAYFGGVATAPTAKLHIAAGSTSASSAPIKLTSGTSMSSAEAGAVEFTTDDLFFTITTGTARKRLLMADAVGGLTSGRSSLSVTTNGRIIDTAVGIDTTAGDAATINALAGRFRKDTSGSTFTLTNSFITANSIIILTLVTAGITTGYQLSVVAGSGSAVITFATAGSAAAPSANCDVNFQVIN